MAKAKANAAQGIPELLEIAVGKHYRENKGDKHTDNARYGWYRYDSRFALPVYGSNGKVERYNVFHASMLIMHDKDEKSLRHNGRKKRNEQPFFCQDKFQKNQQGETGH